MTAIDLPSGEITASIMPLPASETLLRNFVGAFQSFGSNGNGFFVAKRTIPNVSVALPAASVLMAGARIDLPSGAQLSVLVGFRVFDAGRHCGVMPSLVIWPRQSWLLPVSGTRSIASTFL